MGLRRPSFAYEDLAQMPDDGKRYDLYEGELIVSPAPVTKHQRVQARPGNFLFRAEEAGLGDVFYAPTEAYFAPHNVVSPDLFLVLSDFCRVAYLPSVPDFEP